MVEKPNTPLLHCNIMSSSAKKSSIFQRLVRPFIAGLLAAFPLAFTLGVILWLATFIHDFLGPDSFIGKFLRSVGLKFVTSDIVAYLIGMGGSLGLIYLFGLLVESGLKNRWNAMTDWLMTRVPLVSSVYDAAKKLIRIFDVKDQSEMKAMSPVLCHFGGKGGTVMLALLSSQERVRMNDQEYYVVMIPTAPVPFGGGMFLVPVDWITPLDFGFDGLLNVYMSMGVTAPDYLQAQAASHGSSEK